MLSRKNRNLIIKSEQIIIRGCVMAHLKGLDNLYLGNQRFAENLFLERAPGGQRQKIYVTRN